VPGVTGPYGVAIKGIFILIIIVTNIFGIKAAGKFNDGLTLIKLSPLLLTIFGGIVFLTVQPSVASSNFTPLSPAIRSLSGRHWSSFSGRTLDSSFQRYQLTRSIDPRGQFRGSLSSECWSS
jgi:amino acid transporter